MIPVCSTAQRAGVGVAVDGASSYRAMQLERRLVEYSSDRRRETFCKLVLAHPGLRVAVAV